MVVVPAVKPNTTPLAETVAAAVVLLLQVPPLVASVKSSVLPVHTVGEVGKIPAGPLITVIAFVA